MPIGIHPFVVYKLTLLIALLSLSTLTSAQEPAPLSEDSATVFIDNSTTIYTKVDSQAQYPGGRRSWQSFLIKKLRYPQKAQDDEIMGETRISFIVDVDGSISDIKPVLGDPILAEESLRLIRMSGQWLPAIYQGKKVKSIHIQPITYRLETEGLPRRRRK